jgi:hypothetical protein
MCMPFQGPHPLPGAHIPQDHRLVQRPRGQQPPIRRKGHNRHRRIRLETTRLPQRRRLIHIHPHRRPHRQPPPIRRKSHLPHPPLPQTGHRPHPRRIIPPYPLHRPDPNLPRPGRRGPRSGSRNPPASQPGRLHRRPAPRSPPEAAQPHHHRHPRQHPHYPQHPQHQGQRPDPPLPPQRRPARSAKPRPRRIHRPTSPTPHLPPPWIKGLGRLRLIAIGVARLTAPSVPRHHDRHPAKRRRGL